MPKLIYIKYFDLILKFSSPRLHLLLTNNLRNITLPLNTVVEDFGKHLPF